MLAGFPIYADPSKAFWYPLRFLRYVSAGFNIYVLTGYAIAAWATYGYMRAASNSRLAGFVTACAFTCGGFLVSHFGQPMIVQPAAWACVALWSLDSFLRTRRNVCLVALAASECLELLSGQPQIASFTVVLLLAYLVWNGFERSARATIATYLEGAAAIVLGAAAAALSWIPTLAQSTISVRAALDFTTFTDLSLPATHVARFLVYPFVGAGGGASIYHGPILAEQAGAFTETACYVSLATLALAFVAPFSARRRLAWFWIVVACLGLALSVGSALPFAGFTFSLPGFNLFRIPGRHAFEFTLALAALAGLGTSAIELRPRAYGASLAGGIGAAFIIFGIASFDVFSAVAAPISAPATRIFASLFVGEIFILGIVLLPAIELRTGAILACVAVAIGTIPFAATSSWLDSPDASVLAPPDYAVELARLPMRPGDRVYTDGSGSIDALRPNLPLVWNVPIVDGYTAIPSLTNQVFLQIGQGGRLLDPSAPLLDAAAVRYFAVASIAQADLEATAPPTDVLGDFLSIERPEAPRQLDYGLEHETRADRIEIISALGTSINEPQGRTIARLTVRDAAGASESFPLRAGIETAEMAYERPDVIDLVKHRRANVYSRSGPNNWYSAQLPLHLAAPVASVEIAMASNTASITVLNMSLVDTAKNRSYPFSSQSVYYADRTHFRHLGDFGGISLFENLQAFPPAWVARAIPSPGDISNPIGIAIYRERLRHVDLSRDALVFGAHATRATEGSARISHDEPEHRTIDASCVAACLVISSMTFSTDWRARVDGEPADLLRTDGLFQGVIIPPGRHRVNLDYQPVAGTMGLAVSFAAFATLAIWLFYRNRSGVRGTMA
jgi:hypothetical protein